MRKKLGLATAAVVLLAVFVVVLGLGIPTAFDLHGPSATIDEGKTYVAENTFFYSSIYCLDAQQQLTLCYREFNRLGNSRIAAVAQKAGALYFVRQRLDDQWLETVQLEGSRVVAQQALTLGDVQVCGFTAPTFVSVQGGTQPGGVSVYDSATGAVVTTIQPRGSKFILSARYNAGEAVFAQLSDGSVVRWDRSGIYPAQEQLLTPTLPESFTVTFDVRLKCAGVYLGILAALTAVAVLLTVAFGMTRRIAGLSPRVGVRSALVAGILIFLAGSAYLSVDQLANLQDRIVRSRRMASALANTVATLEPTVLNESGFTATSQYKTYFATLTPQNADLVRADLYVAVSGQIPYGHSVSGRYSQRMLQLVRTALKGTESAQLVIYNGEWVTAAASPVMANGLPLAAVLLYEPVSNLVAATADRLLLLLPVSLLCALVAGISTGWWIRSVTGPLKLLTRQMNAMLSGQTVIPTLARGQGELNAMTQAIQDICLDMTVKNYEMNNTVSSYRRFVPNGLTTMLERGSIMEVDAGDINLYRGNVTILSVCNLRQARARLSDESFMSFVNRCFATVESNICEYNGFLLSSGFDLNSLKLFYGDDALATVNSGLALLGQMNAAENWREQTPLLAIIFHRTSFMYGMVGTQSQMFPFLACGEMDFLQGYIGKLGELGVGVATTFAFFDHIAELYPSRYIGYIIDPDNGTTYKLYELLGARNETLRNKLLEYDARLQEAIGLFYKNDFYMARSIFSALLRECPQDGVARWYLFACERLFDGPPTNDKEQYQLFGVAQ